MSNSLVREDIAFNLLDAASGNSDFSPLDSSKDDMQAIVVLVMLSLLLYKGMEGLFIKHMSVFCIGFLASINSEDDPEKLLLHCVSSEYERGKVDSFSYGFGVSKYFLLPSSFSGL